MIDTTIRTALAPLGIPVEPNEYEGSAQEYISFVYQELGAIHADGMPHAIRYILDLHWYLPRGKNPSAGKDRIRHLLKRAGATWPNVVNASDKEGQHYVFECEMAGAVPDMPEDPPAPETPGEPEEPDDG
jgi:hypothetical protein